MNVEDVVAARIAAARLRIAATKKRRTSMEAARSKGLAQRHAAKLRNQAAGVATPVIHNPQASDPTPVDNHEGTAR